MGTLLVSVATTLTPAIAAASAVFSVMAGVPTNCAGTPQAVNNSPVPASVTYACADTRGTESGQATASHGRVSGSSQATSTQNVSIFHGVGTSGRFNDTLTFSKTAPGVPDVFTASVNIEVGGNALSTRITPGGHADGIATVTLGFQGIHQISYVERSDRPFSVLHSGGFTGSGTLGLGAGSVLTSPDVTLAVGDVAFSLSLNLSASAMLPDGIGLVDFLNGIGFAPGMDVFNLPDGYTVSAGTYLVNNRFIDGRAEIPEPSIVSLLAVSVIGCCAMRHRGASIANG